MQSNPKRKKSLPSVTESIGDSSEATSAPSSELSDEKGKNDNNNRQQKMSFKKLSMADFGLAKPDRQTQFDEEENDLEDGEDVPGAFKRPLSAYKLAK